MKIKWGFGLVLCIFLSTQAMETDQREVKARYLKARYLIEREMDLYASFWKAAEQKELRVKDQELATKMVNDYKNNTTNNEKDKK